MKIRITLDKLSDDEIIVEATNNIVVNMVVERPETITEVTFDMLCRELAKSLQYMLSLKDGETITCCNKDVSIDYWMENTKIMQKMLNNQNETTRLLMKMVNEKEDKYRDHLARFL